MLQAGLDISAAHALADSLETSLDSRQAPETGAVAEGTGGEIMVRALEAAGARYIFGIPGTSEVGFIDALVEHPDIQYVLGLHEGPLAAMADGYAKVSGRPAVVNVHSIAGAANALGQLVNSSRDGTPVIFTAGNQDTRLRGHGSFLEAPRLEALPADYTRWGWDVLRADTIPDMLRRAFKMATTPPGGPVFLTFSKDIWKQPGVRAEILPQEKFTVPRLPPEPKGIDRAARMLLAAENALLMAGDEISKYGGRKELAELAELLGAPVVGELVTGHGRINFPTLHPQYLGLFPGQDSFPLKFDVFLNAGGRMFSEFDYQPRPYVSRQVKVIHLSLDTANLARLYPVDVPLVGHSEEALKALAERVRALLTPERRATTAARLEAISRARAALEAVRRRQLEQEWDSTPISSARLASELNLALDPNAIVITETVTSDIFHSTYMEYNNGDPGRTHIASHGGHLGWGIGAACGAKLAAPDREVALLSGDGSFHFGVQGLWTAARYEIPVLFVIWNNGNYQSNRLALAQYGRRAAAANKYIGSYLGDPDIDHVAIARGYGVDGERAAGPDGLRAALRRAVEAVRNGRPYVLDVVIERRFRGSEAAWHEKFSVARMRARR